MASRETSAEPATSPDGSHDNLEHVNDEDLCPICHLLLYHPVTTRCNHTLCSSCMAHWADVSMTSQMTILAPSSSPSMFSGADTEARCPMCRTPTASTLNAEVETRLSQRYPQTYAEREDEESTEEGEESPGAIETLTLCIGNSHKMVSPEAGSQNMHEWRFFVRPSRTDIIQEVQILLHPTFRPNMVFRKDPPYEIRRLGWGYFTITAYVILKPGWSWISEDAEAVPFRRDETKGRLPLDWTLDFSGFEGKGSMGRCRLKVRNEGRAERAERRARRMAEEEGRWEVEWVDDDDENEDEDEHR